MSKSIRIFLVGIAPIVLLGLGAEVHAQNEVDCFHCVDTRDIAAEAVTTGKIKRRAVTTGKIAPMAITSGKIAPKAITSGKIKNGAVTVNKVSNKLSNSLGQFCLPDETVVGMDVNGNFSCEMPQTLASFGNFDSNTRAGDSALSVNAGSQNSAFGRWALKDNDVGGNNIAIGWNALENNTTGGLNSAVGSQTMVSNTTGISNTAVGFFALGLNTTGQGNIGIGLGAGADLTTGDFNIAIGHRGVAAESSTIRIGTNVPSNPRHTRTFIAGIRGITTDINNATTVVIDGDGQLGTISSSSRYKEEIHDMEAASERLLSLRPVTFRYKMAFDGGEKPLQFGLIAEEVAEIFPELVVYNEDQTPESVKYRLLSTLLLNELQKEYRVNQRQEAQLQDMQARLEHLENAKAGASANIQ